MNKKHNTYTYTARNTRDPDKVVTFTLDDERMRVNLTDFLDETHNVITSESRLKEILRQITAKVKPILIKFKERVSGPVHISDVNARLEENKFRIRMWPRVAGLRLAPVGIDMGRVDNEVAAEAFVDELESRKDTKPPAKKFFGPLDYWVGWAGLMLLVGFFLRRYRQSEA